jgi:hypothetical protein
MERSNMELNSTHIADMSITELVSHAPIGWLNSLAHLNIMLMVVTCVGFVSESGWVRA